MRNKVTVLVLIFSLLIINLSSIRIISLDVIENYPFQSNDNLIDAALDFLKTQQSDDGCIGNYLFSSWAAMAISAAVPNMNNWIDLADYLEKNVHFIDSTKATDWERMTLAIVSCDKNPRNFSGIDFVEKIQDFFDGSQISGNSDLLDDIFGILALISSGVGKDSSIIQSLCNYVKNKEQDEGGWGNIDTTSVAVMALIAGGEDKDSEIIKRAISFIKTKQNDNGGFEFMGKSNTATTSWAVQAIVAAGKNPTSIYWEKNGSCPIDYLLNLQQEDGSFNWSENNNMNPIWMTSYAIPALLGKTYPIKILEINNSDENDTSNGSESEKQSNNQDNFQEKTPQSNDLLTISKPENNSIYFYNKELSLPISGIFIIGQVEIIVNANEDVEKVEFYLDNELKYTDYKSPFVWYFNEKGFLSFKKITAKAFLIDDKILIDINNFIKKIEATLSHNYTEKTLNYVVRQLGECAENIENFIDKNCEFDEKEIYILNLFPKLH
jgi:prenyltransferase beta subunit